MNPRRCYLADHALARASSFSASDDLGHLLENVVYLHLRRRGAEVRYVETRSGHKVDFIARRRGKPTELIQVCATLSDEVTRQRELRALRAALQDYRSARGSVVTLTDEGAEDGPRGTIPIVPAWRWLLEPRGE